MNMPFLKPRTDADQVELKRLLRLQELVVAVKRAQREDKAATLIMIEDAVDLLTHGRTKLALDTLNVVLGRYR